MPAATKNADRVVRGGRAFPGAPVIFLLCGGAPPPPPATARLWLAALIRDDCPLSHQLRRSHSHRLPPLAFGSRPLFATTVRSVISSGVRTRAACHRSPSARGARSRRLSA